jgi:O-glycosyl hydrolase
MNNAITKSLVFLLLSSALFISKAVGQITATIDTSQKYQTVFGWGAGLRRCTNVFYEASPTVISKVEDLCFNQLHVNIVRTLCEATLEPVQPTVVFPLDSANLDWTYYDTMKIVYAVQRAQTVSNGRINYVFSTNNSAPPWQKANHKVTWGDTILPSMYQHFVDFISYYMLGMQNRYHLRLNGMSLFNEPGDSTDFETLSSSPVQVRDLVIKMKPRLDSMETVGMILHTDFISPESPTVSGTNTSKVLGGSCIHYVDSAQNGLFADTAAVNSVDILGTHDYYDQGNTADWTGLKSVSMNKPIWVTEVCTGACCPYDASSANAVIQAKWIHRSFTLADARAFSMFSFYDTLPSDTPSVNIGALVIFNNRTDSIIIPKRYYGYKQYVNFVRPGFVRVKSTSTNSSLSVTSFTNPLEDTLVIVAVNDSTGALTNVTFNCPSSDDSINQYVTSDVPDYNATQIANISPPASGQFTTGIEPMSITTFVIPYGVITGMKPDNNLANAIQIFPNPVTDKLIIQSAQKAIIEIFNVQGQLVKSIASNGNKTNIDVSDLSSGVYVVQVKTKSGVVMMKVVKE